MLLAPSRCELFGLVYLEGMSGSPATLKMRRAMGAAGRRRYESRFSAEMAAETLLRGLLALKGD